MTDIYGIVLHNDRYWSGVGRSPSRRRNGRGITNISNYK